MLLSLTPLKIINIFGQYHYMQAKEKLLEELHQYWNNPGVQSSRFISSQSNEMDAEEIINYLRAIVETAFKLNLLTHLEEANCGASVQRVSEILINKKATPFLKSGLMVLSPQQLLQSLLSFSDTDANEMKELANRVKEEYIELNAKGDEKTISFLYAQLKGNVNYYDRYVERTLPINGDEIFCQYDNYLPIYKLLQKYYPQTSIRLITDRRHAVGKFIYVVSFTSFRNFEAKNRNNLLAVVPNYVLEDCRNGKAIIVYNDLAESTYYPPIMHNFVDKLVAAGINSSFFLLSGDWANESLKKRETALARICAVFRTSPPQSNFFMADYFEEAVAYSKKTYFPEFTYVSKLQYLKSSPESLRHFICLNRAVKDYRLFISYFFYANDLREKAYVSQYMYTGPQDFTFGYNQNTGLWKDVPTELFEKFKLSLPWLIDIEDMKSYMWDAVPVEAVNNSFCWVITETSFCEILPEQSFRLTEKTYKPIAFFMPFIMIGNPFLLKKLRERGYQTFSKWWDESYDSIIDPVERMAKITPVILKLSQLSQSQLISMYEEMRPVLLHNHQLLMSSSSAKPLAEAIFNACKTA